jgi:hypothetical protein
MTQQASILQWVNHQRKSLSAGRDEMKKTMTHTNIFPKYLPSAKRSRCEVAVDDDDDLSTDLEGGAFSQESCRSVFEASPHLDDDFISRDLDSSLLDASATIDPTTSFNFANEERLETRKMVRLMQVLSKTNKKT